MRFLNQGIQSGEIGKMLVSCLQLDMLKKIDPPAFLMRYDREKGPTSSISPGYQLPTYQQHFCLLDSKKCYKEDWLIANDLQRSLFVNGSAYN